MASTNLLHGVWHAGVLYAELASWSVGLPLEPTLSCPQMPREARSLSCDRNQCTRSLRTRRLLVKSLVRRDTKRLMAKMIPSKLLAGTLVSERHPTFPSLPHGLLSARFMVREHFDFGSEALAWGPALVGGTRGRFLVFLRRC